jgi:hypothetical protein
MLIAIPPPDGSRPTQVVQMRAQQPTTNGFASAATDPTSDPHAAEAAPVGPGFLSHYALSYAGGALLFLAPLPVSLAAASVAATYLVQTEGGVPGGKASVTG